MWGLAALDAVGRAAWRGNSPPDDDNRGILSISMTRRPVNHHRRYQAVPLSQGFGWIMLLRTDWPRRVAGGLCLNSGMTSPSRRTSTKA